MNGSGDSFLGNTEAEQTPTEGQSLHAARVQKDSHLPSSVHDSGYAIFRKSCVQSHRSKGVTYVARSYRSGWRRRPLASGASSAHTEGTATLTF
jgi:hypothetical protein